MVDPVPSSPSLPDDPIDAAIAHLEEAGFSTDEAKNLIRALRASDPDALRENAPKWVLWCAHIRSCHEGIVDLAAKGVITVQWADDPDDMVLSLATDDGERE